MRQLTLFTLISSDEDILADSDSDDGGEDDGGLQEDILMDTNGQTAAAERPKKKARRKDEKFIHEDADTIVDLADIKAMSKISCKFGLQIKPCRLVAALFLFVHFSLFKQHQNPLKMLPKHRLVQ